MNEIAKLVDEYADVEGSNFEQKENRKNLLKLVKTYKPNKMKVTELRMKIILTDEISICQQPRRFSLMQQKIIEKQVPRWLKE